MNRRGIPPLSAAKAASTLFLLFQLMQPKILLVSDHPELVELMKPWFQKWGFCLTVAASAHEAEEVVEREIEAARPMFDLVITDWNLGSTTGGTLLSTLTMICDQRLKYIIYTGYSSTDGRFRDVDRRWVLEKSSRSEELLELIQARLGLVAEPAQARA